MNLPTPFMEKMQRVLGDEFEAFLHSYQEPRQFGLRVNTAKISPSEFEKIAPFHLKKIPWIDNGYYYQEEDMPSRHPFYYAGLYYLQEPSAMTPASRLPIKPGEKVLDLCAAPGGKATELGARLNRTGLLVANDISASRAKALLKNIEVFGISNSFLINEIPGKISDQFEAFFDKVLVDAPCSGEGMFRKDPDTVKVWDETKPKTCAGLQKEIILQAEKMLKPGGMLLYSTCTFSPEENEQVIAHLLKERPEMSLVEMESYEGFSGGIPEQADGNKELAKCIRIWPHKMSGEGHFLALLQKAGDALMEREGKIQRKMTKQEKKLLEAFFCDILWPLDMEYVEVRKGQVYYVPKDLGERKGITFLRNGLYLGELKKDRFEPSQALAAALKKEEYKAVIDLKWEDERIRRYLKGETIHIEPQETTRDHGWNLLCVNGYPLGWGKLLRGLLKNKYLLSWRMKD